MSENQQQIIINRQNGNTILLNDSHSTQNQNTSINTTRVHFSPKKCWICTNIFELEEIEYNLIQSFYFNQNLDYIVSYNSTNDNKINKIRLISILNKFILSICKCKKKLAHIECFNNYIDAKQNGNIAIDIYCSQCNFKYEFDYPFNGLNLKFFDIFDQVLYCSSSIMTICLCVASSYWCCLTYGVITVLQINGYKEGFRILNTSSNFSMFGLLPTIPIALVAFRFIPVSGLIDKLLPTYSITELSRKINENGYDQLPEDDDEKEDAKFMSKIRLVVGGLLLPTIAISVDKFFLSRLNLVNSVLVRTTISGIIFIGAKNLVKTLSKRKKIWQQMNRDIRNYVPCD
ncbi:unnamed protein product [Brachionus calyciflorus]|uniref:RING-CH-type domain-containing protein n=1 Tax=Brachionus calyciflorus TaxID=104777 RepID=A0A813P8Q3_9BILA|nr:unnamed protein product [Brachionus calyciflorus]